MNKKVKVLVLGAGAGGLGASVWLQENGIDFCTFDGNSELPLNLQNGVHYLHSIPQLPFETDIKKITLTDAILFGEKMYDKPSLKFSLQYSEKTGEFQRPSSIMSVGKEDTAYMPKSNSLNSLLQEMYSFVDVDRFNFGWWLVSLDSIAKIAMFKRGDEVCHVHYEFLISTLPLDKMKAMLHDEWIASLKTECNSIFIANYKIDRIVPNWMINVYIPDFRTPIYRASFLNGICSVESIKELDEHDIHSIKDYLSMFYLKLEGVEKYNWKTGKVISISQDDRLKLTELVAKKNIFLVGRFANWDRKLLIDSTINQAKEAVDKIIKLTQ